MTGKVRAGVRGVGGGERGEEERKEEGKKKREREAFSRRKAGIN